MKIKSKITTGKELKEFRKEIRLTVEQFAIETHISERDIINAEKAPRRKLKDELVSKIEKFTKQDNLLFKILAWWRS